MVHPHTFSERACNVQLIFFSLVCFFVSIFFWISDCLSFAHFFVRCGRFVHTAQLILMHCSISMQKGKKRFRCAKCIQQQQQTCRVFHIFEWLLLLCWHRKNKQSSTAHRSICTLLVSLSLLYKCACFVIFTACRFCALEKKRNSCEINIFFCRLFVSSPCRCVFEFAIDLGLSKEIAFSYVIIVAVGCFAMCEILFFVSRSYGWQ